MLQCIRIYVYIKLACLVCYTILLAIINGAEVTGLSPIKKTLTSNGYMGYSISLYFPGTDQEMKFLVDTGSTNVAVPCVPTPSVSKYLHIKKSKSRKLKGFAATVKYTKGSWTGILNSDWISLSTPSEMQSNGSNLTSIYTDFSCIIQSDDFLISGSGWQGILGLAYGAISHPDSEAAVPFMDRLHAAGYPDTFEMQLCGFPSSHAFQMTGSMTFGIHLNPSIQNNYLWVPLYQRIYYDVVVSGILIDNAALNVHCKEYNRQKTIVDSGSEGVLLPERVFRVLEATISSSLWTSIDYSFWRGQSQLCWPIGDVPYSHWPTVSIELSMTYNTTIHVSILPEQYLRPVTSLLDFENCFRFGFSSSKNNDFILGEMFMESVDIVFDRGSGRLGFKNTTCEKWTGRGRHPTVTGPHNLETTNNTASCTSEKALPPWIAPSWVTKILFYCAIIAAVLLAFASGYFLFDYCKLGTREERTRLLPAPSQR